MTTKPVGLYVHIPYCVRKCGYCDFCSRASASGIPDGYIASLLSEAELYKEKRLSLDTVYIGGGTPSLMTPKQLSTLVLGLRECFDILPSAEFTVECNPGTARFDFFRECRRLGINRISFGLQSVHDSELRLLERIHTYADFLAAYGEARDAGIENISVDLMYGIPEQTEESFSETLASAVALGVEHISAYGLIIEEGTRFFNERDSLSLPDEDAECDMYYLADRYLTENGFSHYEVSNYAREGRESRHNLKYWHLEEYIGLGASAHSFFGGKRYYNALDVDGYVSRARGVLGICEESDPKSEYIMLKLRLKEGLSLSEYEGMFGVDLLSEKSEAVERFVSLGLVELCQGQLFLTAEGFYLSNLIIGELI